MVLYIPSSMLVSLFILFSIQRTFKRPSPIQAHIQSSGHQLSQDNFNIIGREGQDLTRLIKESIYIRVNNPTLNRNIGKFQLNCIWDRVLFSTPNIKVAIPAVNAHLMKSRVLEESLSMLNQSSVWRIIIYCIMLYQQNDKSTQLFQLILNFVTNKMMALTMP